jgi:hypothetical protein
MVVVNRVTDGGGEQSYARTDSSPTTSVLPCQFSFSHCYVCIAVLHALGAGLLASSQYPEGPATGHLDTGFSWFPCV